MYETDIYYREITTASVICGLALLTCLLILVLCVFIYRRESHKPLLGRDINRYKTKGLSRSQSTSYHNTSANLTEDNNSNNDDQDT